MTKYFLYGHYDSRGGATLIEDDTKEAAHFRYTSMFCNEDTEWGTKEAQDKQLIEEDFIAEVAFSSYREVADGEDLEYGELEPGTTTLANAFEDGLAWATEEIVQTTANPFRELLWERRNESDEVVELRLCAKGHNPAYEDQSRLPGPCKWYSNPQAKIPGWKRSSLGEDACGVILMKKGA